MHPDIQLELEPESHQSGYYMFDQFQDVNTNMNSFDREGWDG